MKARSNIPYLSHMYTYIHIQLNLFGYWTLNIYYYYYTYVYMSLMLSTRSDAIAIFTQTYRKLISTLILNFNSINSR